MVIAGVSSLCPAIVKLLPGVSVGATDEIRCRNAGREGNRGRSDKGSRKPLRMTSQAERLRHRKRRGQKASSEAVQNYDTRQGR
jgi:hypothetical protein